MIAYAANDVETVRGRVATLSVSTTNWTLAAQGNLLTIASGGNGLLLGQTLLLQQTSKPSAYVRATKVLSDTSIFVVPIQSAGDGAGALGTVYTNTATLSSGNAIDAWEAQALCTIDLAEAREETHTFLVFGAASLSHSLASRESRCRLTINAKTDDPYSGDANHGEALVTLADSAEVFLANFVRLITIPAGDRRDFALQTRNGGSSGRSKLGSGHIYAVRVDKWSGLLQGANSGTNTSATTAATSTDVVVETVTVPTSQSYFVAGSALIAHSSGTAANRVVEVKVKNNGIAIHTARIKLRNTTDRVPIGFATFVSGVATGTIQVTINNVGASGNAEARNSILVALPLVAASLPPWLAGFATNNQAASGITGDNDYVDALTSASQTLVAGTHVEFVTTGNGINTGTPASDFSAIRPVWGGDYPEGQAGGTEPLIYEDNAPARGNFGHGESSATGVANSLNFFLWRGVRRAGSTTNKLQTRRPNGGTFDAYVGPTRFVWLRETDVVEPGAAEPTTIAVEMETGLVVKQWDATGTAGLYQKHLPDTVDIDRGILNGVEVTQAAVQGSSPQLAAANTWGWDATNRIAYVYMPSTPANRSPNDDRETFVLVPVERLSTSPEGLTDDAGLLRRYQPRLVREPRVRTELQIRGQGTEAGTSIGELEIVAADGKFDDRVVREVWEGLFATIYRGHRRLSGRLVDFQAIGRATTALPKLDTGKLTVGLYDRALQLARPVSESRVTTYTGTGANETVRDFVVLPVVVGSPQRVPAYRVSSDAASPTEHWFKVCQHSVVAFGNVYASAESQTAIATGYTPTAADLQCGQFKVKNAAGGGDAAYNSDTLYVDIAGGVGAGVATAGAVLEFLFRSYPERIDEFAGSPSTTIASANHTSAAAGANCQVAATTGFAVGDRVKVISNAAATTYYHATVTAILAGPARLTLVPCYETGDAVVGTSFTFGAASSVMKVAFAGGVGATSLVQDTFRKLDRRWRKQLTGGALIPSAPKLDLVLGSDVTVADAASMVCRSVFAYWMSNPIGRLFVGVPDQDVASLTDNAGFERDTTTSPATSRSIFPWTAEAGLTAQITTGVRYQGQQAIEITRGALQQTAALRQAVELPGGGLAGNFVATALVGLRAGDGTAVRLRVTLPSDGQSTPDYAALSDPIMVESGRWSRITFPFKVPRGGSGRALLDLLPFYPDKTPALPSIIGTAFLGAFAANASLVGWLDASNADGFGLALPQNGSKLGTWKNLAGGTDATITGAKRPRWWRNALLTRPGVRFDDTDDTMAWITLGAAPYTVFVVYALSNDDTVTFHRALSGGSTNWMMGPHPGGGSSYLFNAYTGGTGGPTGGYVGAGLALAAGQFAYCGLVATSNALAEHFVNGTSVGTNTATSQPAPGVLNLGKGGSTAQSLYGTICEVLVWNRALTTGERQAVEAYLAAKYGISSVTLAVDDFEAFKVAAVLKDTTADPLPLEYDPDSSFETEVPFNVNTQQTDFASFIRVTDSEARQLTTAVSQAKNALPGAKRLVLTNVALQDAASAGGVAAAYSGYFGRLRHRIDFRQENAGNRVPMVGERAIHRRAPRVPELIDEHPVHLIVAVETFGKGAKGVDLKTERQTDLVSDRTTIAASDLPLGLIFVTTASSCPGSGYSEEVTALRGYYVQGALVADTTTPVGSPTHRHQASHAHDLANHVHTFDFAIENLGLDDAGYDFTVLTEFAGPNNWPLEFNYPMSNGFAASGGSHIHAMGSTGKTTGNPSPAATSSAPTSTLYTYFGGNDVSWRRVLFCRRTGGSGNFPTSLIAGYGLATAPGGWNRCDGGGGRPNLDGLALRAARPEVDGTDTTTKTGTTFSPSNAAAGSSLFLTSAANVKLYQRLTITNGANTIHVAVVQAPGTGGLAVDECKVQTLHEDGDTADVADGGTTYAAGSTVGIDDERANVSVTIAAHRHQKSGGVGTGAIPNHQHTASHRHQGSTTYVTGTDTGSFNSTRFVGKPYGFVSTSGHQHSITVTTPLDATASSNAGGDITSATTNAADRFAVVFIAPADANQNVLQAGMMFFSDSTCPSGFEVADDAAGLLIVGAAAAAAGGAIVGGHSHGFDAASHTVTHRHHDLAIGTGKFRQQTDPDNSNGVAPAGDAGVDGIGVVAGDTYNAGHFHRALIENVQSVVATLSARTSQTTEVVSGNAASPPALRLLVCRKT